MPEAVPGLVDVARVALADHVLCALHVDGSVSCMQTWQELGDPIQIPNLIADDLELVGHRACALTRGPDPALVCWECDLTSAKSINLYDHGAALGLSLAGARGLTLDGNAGLRGFGGPNHAGCIDMASERGPTCWSDGEVWYPFADPIDVEEGSPP